ncbi:MAG: serine/threonine-protein kinase [Candidatus Melainabacteria bacterium]|nr:serine/threonine-protein kinase [Candidatus Melainabacteria bacterium]
MLQDTQPLAIQLNYQPGYIVDRVYLLKELIGRGGMGSVFRAEHLVLKKEYALKLLASGTLQSEQWQRFSLEARAIAKINHPAIIKIHNMGLDSDGVPYYVMDLLPGTTLFDYCKEDSVISVAETIDVFKQIASGLSYAHGLRLVHRDIKPSNIMLSRTKTGFDVKIVDFGIVKLLSDSSLNSQVQTKAGQVIGSVLYMSPEQSLGPACDQRSDIYSLGCTLYQVLAKHPPFEGKSDVETIFMHQSQPAPALNATCLDAKFTPGLNHLVSKMLEKNPKQRYQSMSEVIHDLERIEQGKSIGTGAANTASDATYNIENGAASQSSAIRRGPDGDSLDWVVEKEQGSPFFANKRRVFLGGGATLLSVALASAVVSYSAKLCLTDEKGSQKQIGENLSLKQNEQKRIVPSPFSRASIIADPNDEKALSVLEQVVSIKGKLVRTDEEEQIVINFPKERIGYFDYFGRDKQHVWRKAQNDCTVPSDRSIRLIVSPDALVAFFHPHVYSKIDPSLFNNLKVSGKPDETEFFFPEDYLPKCSAQALRIIEIASDWEQLRVLEVDGVNFSSLDDLSCFNKFEHLRLLRLRQISNLPGRSLAKLRIFDSLKELQLISSSPIDDFFANISSRSKLEKIVLDNITLSEATLADLAKLSHLKCLTISSVKLNDGEIKAIAKLKQIAYLCITGTTVSARQFACLVSMPQLKVLSIGGVDYKVASGKASRIKANPCRWLDYN